MPCRKDKYEPKNPDKIQYAYEEEVVASKENAEEERYVEDTDLADGEVSSLPLGLQDFVDDSSDEENESEEEDDDSQAVSPAVTRKNKRMAKDSCEEELPIEDIQIPLRTHACMP